MAGNKLTLEVDNKDTQIILEKYVKPVMQKILLEHIREDIYGSSPSSSYAGRPARTPYDKAGLPAPKQYVRSYNLLDAGNIVTELDGNTLYMTSNAQPPTVWSGSWSATEGGFLALLEGGDLGVWRKGFPRPALTNAQREVDRSQAIQSAIRKGFEEVFNSKNI